MNTVIARTTDDKFVVDFKSRADSFLTNAQAAVARLNDAGANVTVGDMGKTWQVSVI